MPSVQVSEMCLVSADSGQGVEHRLASTSATFKQKLVLEIQNHQDIESVGRVDHY